MESIKYFAREDCPGDFFECGKLSATLSKSSCASMWRKAFSRNGNYQEKCRGCPIGAMHAGEHEISTSRLAGKKICVRCHRASNRFVFNDICVSCYNREREWVKGRNAKGTKPVKQKPLHSLTLPYLTAEKQVGVVRKKTAESTSEMITKVLRDSQKKVMFGFFKGVLS